jgi:hypothetical protein
MKTLYSVAFILFFVGFTQAQNDWVTGAVVLKSDQVLVGEISKKPVHELILVKDKEGIHALAAHQVSHYRFYDEASNINRQFISVKSSDVYGTHKFFEIVIQGNIKVLRKYHKKTPFDELNEAYDFDFFVLLNEALVPITRFKNDIYPKLFKQQPVEISAFVSANQLRISDLSAAFSLIKHYNSIDKKSELLAQID